MCRINWGDDNRRFALGGLIATLLACTAPVLADTEPYDIALNGGLVIDPESRLHAIRNVGILGDRIAVISEDEISAKRHVDVSGLVVAAKATDIYPTNSLGTVMGLVEAGRGVGIAVGPLLGGLLFDLRGDYVLAFSLSMALTFASICSMWLIGSGSGEKG